MNRPKRRETTAIILRDDGRLLRHRRIYSVERTIEYAAHTNEFCGSVPAYTTILAKALIVGTTGHWNCLILYEASRAMKLPPIAKWFGTLAEAKRWTMAVVRKRKLAHKAAMKSVIRERRARERANPVLRKILHQQKQRRIRAVKLEPAK